MSMVWQPPYREISLIRNSDRDYLFSFENMNGPVIPNFSGDYAQPMRPLFDFPDGTVFKFRAKDDLIDIQRTGTWDDTTKEIKFSFKSIDTLNVRRNRRVYYEMDAIFPLPEDAPVDAIPPRYTILVGYLVIFATQNFNG